MTRFVLQVADSEPRIRRVYFYQWNADSLLQAWDSGFIDPFGHRRAAFDVLARHAGRDPRRAPGDPVFAAPVEPSSASEQPPPSQGGPPPQDSPPQQQQQQQPQDPPPPSCTLPPPLCPGVLPG